MSFISWFRSPAVRAYRKVKNLFRPHRVAHELNRWTLRRTAIVEAGRRRPHARIDCLGLTPDQLQTLEAEAARDGVAIVAAIDQDGYWQSRIGPIEGVPTLASGDFLPRRKFDVDVVWSHDYFGVRKRYRGNSIAFLNELSTLDRLGRLGMRVPAILDIDFDHPALVVSYIRGRVLREDLVRAGAPVRNRDRVEGFTPRQSWQRALKAGVAVLPRVTSREFIAELAHDLQRFHDAGVMLLDIKWGNIIIGSDGRPWWLDFHLAEDHSELSRESFRVLADLDVERFNRSFGTAYPTPTRRWRAVGPA